MFNIVQMFNNTCAKAPGFEDTVVQMFNIVQGSKTSNSQFAVNQKSKSPYLLAPFHGVPTW